MKNWTSKELEKLKKKDIKQYCDVRAKLVKYKPVAPKSQFKRNDPCPCGSGKKLKKCCIDKTYKELVS